MSTSAKARAGGVLPINPAVTRKPVAVQKSASRSPAPKLRLIVRRLPPGLTEHEFWEGVGSEWQSGRGKVDWFAFKSGKISRDPSKPSRPGRAYLRVKDQSSLEILSVTVKQAQFKDAKNTASDPCLVGPPSLEFAPYNKTPGGRARNDGRQGTIDQDQEFIDFLQSLTEPITKPTANGPEGGESKSEKVTTTPLVQFIKEKKANKAKDKEAAAASKVPKKQEGKEVKPKTEPKATVVVKNNTTAAEKARVAKATQDAVKAINKSVASMQTKTATPKVESKVKEAAPAQPPTPKRERERGSASVAARMISRDLGLAPKEPRTPRTPRSVTSTASTPSTAATTSKSDAALVSASTLATPVASTPTTKSSTPTVASTAPPTGPRSARGTTPQQPKQPLPTPQRQAKPTPQPTAGAKSAFLKHANPSQGVTEELLRATFAVFGEITRCEIDKKKGLGYIDFIDTESLKKAMSASPVKIGNGQVTVLENRSPYRKGLGQQRVGDSTVITQVPSVATSAASSPQATTASVASTPVIASVPSTAASESIPPTVEASATSTTITPATQTTGDSSTPIAPRNTRAGGAAGRGARGAANSSSPGRAGFTNRAPRANFRGGRGGRGARGAATAVATGTPSATSTANAIPVISAGQGAGGS